MTTKILKIKVVDVEREFEISMNQSTWCIIELNCQEFFGKSNLVMNGHFNYNHKDVVIYLDNEKFYFFQEMFRKELKKIAKKLKYIN